MATAPTTLIPPGAGGPVMLDFCECACGILAAAVYVRTRSAQAGFLYDSPTDPSRVPGENPFNLAQTRLAAAAYSDYGFAPPALGANLWGTIATAQTLWGTTAITFNPEDPPPGTAYSQTTTTLNGINTDTGSHPDANGYTQASAQLQEAQYKLRVDFQYPWQGSSQLQVSWRERTVNYNLSTSKVATESYDSEGAGSVDPPVISNDENGSFSYKGHSVMLRPNEGDMFVETPEYDLPANGLTLGDQVSITGPEEIGSFFSRVSPDGCGINVTAFAADAYKIGFLPYLRAHAAAGDAEAAQPVDLYATETASVAQGFTADYSGNQTTLPHNQIAATAQGGIAQNTFSADIPYGLQSQVEPGLPPSTVDAVSLNPTSVQWNDPAGLVMTLSDPISTAALLAFVQAAFAAAPSPLNGDGTGILALRNLPADELSYSAKQSTRTGFLNIAIDSGIPSQIVADPSPPSVAVYSGHPVTVTVDLLTTDLDTGAHTDSQLSFDFALVDPDPLAGGVERTDYGIYQFELTADSVAVPIPDTNQIITWSNPQVTTDVLDRWCVAPQVQVIGG